MKPRFFAKPEQFREWLEQHHASTMELWVGFYRKESGRASLTWPQSVDGALCYGWIDGLRKKLDEESYAIRFTPRRPGSRWSQVNVKRVEELTKQGLMREPGLQAFAARTDEPTYGYEQRHSSALNAEEEMQFRAKKKAWEFFAAQPAGYRNTAAFWVISAKKPETRERRLRTLMEDSANGQRIGPLRREK